MVCRFQHKRRNLYFRYGTSEIAISGEYCHSCLKIKNLYFKVEKSFQAHGQSFPGLWRNSVHRYMPKKLQWTGIIMPRCWQKCLKWLSRKGEGIWWKESCFSRTIRLCTLRGLQPSTLHFRPSPLRLFSVFQFEKGPRRAKIFQWRRNESGCRRPFLTKPAKIFQWVNNPLWQM